MLGGFAKLIPKLILFFLTALFSFFIKKKVFDDFATTFECEGFNKFDIQSQIEELYENRYYEKSQFYGHDLKTTAYKYELVYTDESCQDLKMFTKHEENNKQIKKNIAHFF